MIRKRRLTSKFKTSQPSYQKTTIHLLRNMSQSKGKQTMKCGQLIDYNQKNHAENEARFFRKVLSFLEKSWSIS